MPGRTSDPVAVDPDVRPAAGRDRWAWRWIIIAVAVGATIRLVILATKWNQSLLLNDSLYYSSQAWQNAQGRWFRDFLGGHPGAEHAPLTSLVLTPSSLLPRHEFWQRATNTLIGIVTVALIGRLAWRVAGRRVGVMAAFIAALYPNLWMNDSLIMAETISTLTAVIALWFAVRHAERLSLPSALLCGLAVGLATLARSELLLLAPLFALIGLRREPWNWVQLRRWAGRALVVVAAAVALLVPWTLYNLSRFDAPVLLSTNAGGALLGANCPDTYYGPSVGGWSVLCLIEDDRPGEDVSERSQRWQDQAVTYVENNTRRVPVVVGARLLRAADLYGLADLVRFDVGEERMRWASWAGIATWWLMAPLAVVGWLRQPRTGSAGSNASNRWILLSPAIGVVVVTVLFYGSHRLRSPIEPVVVICAASALTAFGRVQRAIDGGMRWADRRG